MPSELGEADASAAAEALLGEAAEADSSSTRYEILYSADSGSVSFSRSGALHAELSAAVGGRSYEQDMQRRLRGMGYTVWQTQPPSGRPTASMRWAWSRRCWACRSSAGR